MMSIVAIIQARTGSTRLPGKVLMPIGEYPMLWHVVQRVQCSHILDKVVVATTNRPEDQAIVDMCDGYGWSYFRGSEQDVLDRYYQASRTFGARVVVRITSDCPFIDAGVLDGTIAMHLESQADYTSNTLSPRSFPHGLDVEVIQWSALARAWREDDNSLGWREHVTPYIYRNPELFKLSAFRCSQSYAHLRWTVDTPEDLLFVRTVLKGVGKLIPTWYEVLDYILSNPDVISINSAVVQKSVM